jgi:L-iditol 2-dehydrogenase
MCEHLFNSALDPGGFSEYARVPAPLVQQGMYHFPTTIDETMGTLVEPLACCLHAMHAMNLTQGDSLLIIGDGTMGLLQAELARTLGAHPIIVSGTMPHRLERASRAADIIINAWSEDMVGRVKQITGGYGVDKVLVSVPNAHLVEEAMAVAARGGTVSLFAGLSEQDHLAISAHRIHYDEVRLLGTFGFGPDDFRQAADMIISQSIHVDGIVTDIVDFGSVDYALRHATPEHGIKAAVRMR